MFADNFSFAKKVFIDETSFFSRYNLSRNHLQNHFQTTALSPKSKKKVYILLCSQNPH